MINSNVSVINRNLITVNGLKSVIQTLDNECIFYTDMGTVKISGAGLEVLKLSLSMGYVTLTGTFYGINYV